MDNERAGINHEPSEPWPVAIVILVDIHLDVFGRSLVYTNALDYKYYLVP